MEENKAEGLTGEATPCNPTPVTCDIFIKTCEHDAGYHAHCLASVRKYCSGFGEVVVVEGEHPRGYLHQQVVKLHADKHTDAEFILVTDSDTLFTEPVTPDSFMVEGKPVWIHTPFTAAMLEHPGTRAWFHVMKEFFGVEPKSEFMRRQPFMFPRRVLEGLRQLCRNRHGVSIEDYIMGRKSFSEWNVLGMYCWAFHRDAFHWVDTSKDELPELLVRQFWSHDPVEKNLGEIEGILNDQV